MARSVTAISSDEQKLTKRKKKWQCVTPLTGHRIVDPLVKTKNTKNDKDVGGRWRTASLYCAV